MVLNFLVINDFNDINSIDIHHFSLDKGHFIAKSFAKLGHLVYYATTKKDYEKNGIKYIAINKITTTFLDNINYVIIPREPLIIDIIKKIPAINVKMGTLIKNRNNPKFIIKSDAPLWFNDKKFIAEICQIYGIKKIRSVVKKWIVEHIDYICAQNEEFAKLALNAGVPKGSILISNMGIPNIPIEYDKLVNPYDIEHSYCVNNASKLGKNKALWPLYYLDHPEERDKFNVKKYIIVYTGRIKVDNGKIMSNMANIMKNLGDEYELHIFPGSFVIQENGKNVQYSSKNSHSLERLREIFRDNKNIIIHYPYTHEDKYKYLNFADCGIDFSDIRPRKAVAMAGHAKILEYCEVGLPIVCENNINNLFLVKNGKNGIILAYMASDLEYSDAIKKIVNMKIDREYCRKITVKNENWDKKTKELLDQIL